MSFTWIRQLAPPLEMQTKSASPLITVPRKRICVRSPKFRVIGIFAPAIGAC